MNPAETVDPPGAMGHRVCPPCSVNSVVTHGARKTGPGSCSEHQSMLTTVRKPCSRCKQRPRARLVTGMATCWCRVCKSEYQRKWLNRKREEREHNGK